MSYVTLKAQRTQALKKKNANANAKIQQALFEQMGVNGDGAILYT